MFFDPNYLLWVLIPGLLISFAAQMMIRNAYGKWSRVRNGPGLTGAQIAQIIIDRTPVGDVAYGSAQLRYTGASMSSISLARVRGELTDHYDPRTHTVRLSDSTASQPSVVAMAVVAHELGHAQQHEEGSLLIHMRNLLIPAMQVSPMISYGLIMIGLLFNLLGLFWLGILFFSVTVLFALLTLPVEIDASMRAMRLLNQAGLVVTTEDAQGAREVLTAAALTYVAAAVTAILQLLYYISLANRRR
ncbi:MAG: zinc metallopeptidase [Anaerolineae bacterium]